MLANAEQAVEQLAELHIVEQAEERQRQQSALAREALGIMQSVRLREGAAVALEVELAAANQKVATLLDEALQQADDDDDDVTWVQLRALLAAARRRPQVEWTESELNARVHEEVRDQLEQRDAGWLEFADQQRALVESDRDWAEQYIAALRGNLEEARDELAAEQREHESLTAWCRDAGRVPPWMAAEAEARGQIQPHASMLAFILPPIPQ